MKRFTAASFLQRLIVVFWWLVVLFPPLFSGGLDDRKQHCALLWNVWVFIVWSIFCDGWGSGPHSGAKESQSESEDPETACRNWLVTQKDHKYYMQLYKPLQFPQNTSVNSSCIFLTLQVFSLVLISAIVTPIFQFSIRNFSKHSQNVGSTVNTTHTCHESSPNWAKFQSQKRIFQLFIEGLVPYKSGWFAIWLVFSWPWFGGKNPGKIHLDFLIFCWFLQKKYDKKTLHLFFQHPPMDL